MELNKKKVPKRELKVRMDDALWRRLEKQRTTAGMDRSKYVRELIQKPRAFSKFNWF